MKSIILSLVVLLNCLALGYAQTVTLKGNVTQPENIPVAGASIVVKGKVAGTTTNDKGQFEFTFKAQPSIVLLITAIGFAPQEIAVANTDAALNISLQPAAGYSGEVVVTASRMAENIMRSPVSIEKLNLKTIQYSAATNFYEELRNLKGVEMVTSSLTYSQINARGFNTTGNARFLQLIDGVDNQPPGLNFSVGNLLGASELDLESAELIPGAASALYGPAAFNGVLMMTTKDPFKHQGLSLQLKGGFNNFGATETDPRPLGDVALRYAKALGNKFAIKLNVAYLKGYDWLANNYTDVDAQTPPAQRGENNPARNGLNLYGDEVVRTINGVGRVSRTGYEERFLMNYDVYSLRAGAAAHYRISNNMEAIYEYRISNGTTAYTGSNRFSLNNFTLHNHRAELRGAQYFIRAYTSEENSHNSYNARSLGQLINRAWVQNPGGGVASPQDADNVWFERYRLAYTGALPGITPSNHAAARAYADQGRLIPGTPAFENAKAALIARQGMGGAGIISRGRFFHTEGQYDLSSITGPVANLLIGGNYRKYTMATNGTLFDDKDKKVTVQEYGMFAQATRLLLENRLKLVASLRFDKNENFKGSLTPRFSAVYTAAKNHHFRASYQTGFRNPTPVDLFIKLNAGPITILGGAPANSKGMNVYENSVTAASMGAFGAAFGAAVAGGANPQQAIMQHKNLLVKSNVAYIQPEKLTTFEVGYKAVVAHKLLIDANYYYSTYRNFILNQVVLRPNSPVLGADGTINPAAAADLLNGQSSLFQLYTNAADKVSTQGATLGLTYSFGKGYQAGGNATWAKFNILDANPNNVPAFNTPTWRTNFTLSNPNVYKGFGFSAAWRWQDAFEWFGTFNEMRPGTINAFHTIDAALSYAVAKPNMIFKWGGSNILNHKVYQAFGSPAVGAVYYVSVLFNQLLK